MPVRYLAALTGAAVLMVFVMGYEKSGAHDYPSAVPGKAENKSGFACYSAADIQRKISESLAIAAECDEIAIRYKALAESCK